MRTIVDIPDASLLASHTLTDLVGEIATSIGVDKPDVVAIPMIDFGGANYPSRKIDRNLGLWSAYDVEKVAAEIREKLGAKVYLSVVATFGFLNAKPFAVRDQFGDDKTGVCIVNPHIQRLLQAAFAEGIELAKPDGIVLDICDINGQDSRGDGRINFTCFCGHCATQLRDVAKFDFNILKNHPNPVNIGLRTTPTGINHFPIDSRAMSETDLILCRSLFLPWMLC